jgi:hypothetical protein
MTPQTSRILSFAWKSRTRPTQHLPQIRYCITKTPKTFIFPFRREPGRQFKEFEFGETVGSPRVCIFSFFQKKSNVMLFMPIPLNRCFFACSARAAASLLVPLKPPLDRLPDLLDHEDEDGKRNEEEPRSAPAQGAGTL